MEPRDLRESPAGSGDSQAGEWRAEIAGGDAEVKGVETNNNETTTRETSHEDAYEGGGGGRERQKSEGPQSPYEEELDPRIQVGE